MCNCAYIAASEACAQLKLMISETRESILPIKDPRIHRFKMTDSIDRIVKNIIHMRPNFASLE